LLLLLLLFSYLHLLEIVRDQRDLF